eukprot:GHVU01146900.1.p2 GENE.GHVU01146900.1~~GHVU01146900.1.p2  ORF type:complete len:116 (-),score=13.63 GHVU01146900.1:25-372(-)
MPGEELDVPSSESDEEFFSDEAEEEWRDGDPDQTEGNPEAPEQSEHRSAGRSGTDVTPDDVLAELLDLTRQLVFPDETGTGDRSPTHGLVEPDLPGVGTESDPEGERSKSRKVWK